MRKTQSEASQQVKKQKKQINFQASLLAGISDAVIATDEQFRVLSWNPAAQAMYGHAEEEVLGKPLAEIFQNEYLSGETRAEALKHLFETGNWRGEVNQTRKDGSWFPVHASVSLLYDANGQPDGAVAINRDITDQKLAEKEIRSLSKFPAENPNPILRISLSGCILYANPASAPVLAAWARQVGEDVPADLLRHISAVYTSQPLVEFELNCLDQIFLFTITPVPSEGYVNIYGRNITRRIKLEEELAHSQQMLQLVLDNIPQGVFWKDKDLNYLGCNKAHARIVNLETPEQITGKNDYDFYTKTYAELYRSIDRQVITTGEPQLSYEELEKFPDGREMWDRTSKVPLKDSGGVIFGVLGTYEDITPTKQLEQELRLAVDRLAAVNRVGRVITASLDLDSVYAAFIDEMRTLVHFDCTSIVLFDKERDRMRITHQWIDGAATYPQEAWTPLEGSAAAWVAQHKQAVLEKSAGETINWLDGALPCLDGHQSCVLLPLIHHEEVIGVLTLGSRRINAYAENDLETLQSMADLLAMAVLNTRLYREIQSWAAELEERVAERTAQLEKANLDMQGFTYSVSHDLRAPLRAITGFSQILIERHRTQLDEEGRHFLDNIVEASNRMSALIEDLLRYTRIGRSGVRQNQVSLRTFFGHLLINLEESVLHGSASLELPLAHDLPEITSDQTLLTQIFTNLIENALIYHPASLPPRVKVTCRDEGDTLLFAVIDHGIGIPLEYQEKIFNVFQRLHSADEYPGTGIGLAIVKKSVDLLGGRVWVESAPDQGSTFWVQLPKE